jgi:transposase-like protein
VQKFTLVTIFLKWYNYSLSAKLSIIMTKWTEEDKEVTRLLLEQGLNIAEVSAETSIPPGTINGWKTKWGIKHKKSYKYLYEGTVEEVQARLIKIMQEAPEVSYNYFNSASSSVPSATSYRKIFGSWEEALKAAGIHNISTQEVNKLTVVYLVEFEDFYKVGITQQTVDQRLGGRYPAYQILAIKEYPTLIQAKSMEKELLDLVKGYSYIPTNFPAEGRGFTECFKMPKNEVELLIQKLL